MSIVHTRPNDRPRNIPIDDLPPRRMAKAVDLRSFIKAFGGELVIGRSSRGSDFTAAVRDLCNAGLVDVEDRPGAPLVLRLIGGRR